MPRGPKAEKRPDVNARAAMITKIATGEIDDADLQDYNSGVGSVPRFATIKLRHDRFRCPFATVPQIALWKRWHAPLDRNDSDVEPLRLRDFRRPRPPADQRAMAGHFARARRGPCSYRNPERKAPLRFLHRDRSSHQMVRGSQTGERTRGPCTADHRYGEASFA